jgi:hypothetical protein
MGPYYRATKHKQLGKTENKRWTNENAEPSSSSPQPSTPPHHLHHRRTATPSSSPPRRRPPHNRTFMSSLHSLPHPEPQILQPKWIFPFFCSQVNFLFQFVYLFVYLSLSLFLLGCWFSWYEFNWVMFWLFRFHCSPCKCMISLLTLG